MVIGLIQWVTGGAGDHGIELARYRYFSILANEVHRLQVAGDDVAKIDKSEPTLIVDDGVDRISTAEQIDDSQLLFVQWIASQVAVGGVGVRHKVSVVKRSDRLLPSDTGGDDFATTGNNRP